MGERKAYKTDLTVVVASPPGPVIGAARLVMFAAVTAVGINTLLIHKGRSGTRSSISGASASR
ncbi:hypothetical protein [Streptomyces hokutonensis]|uniref:hypothetical protein n=1 Tax=Streptomyces hokutonensis TaxID=1306990 RepID=UPI0033F3E613